MTRLLMTAALLLAAAGGAFAQTGAIRGAVTDAATGEALAGVDLFVRGTTARGLTNARGEYHIRGIAPGTYTLEAVRVGYARATAVFEVPAGATAPVTVDLSLSQTAVALEGLTVLAASRRTEKITEAPATINVITSQEVAEHPSFNTGELAARQKGVDYLRSGVAVTGFNVRGFNSAFNPKNLQMTDGRLSTLVATGLPWGPLSPTVKDDIERIEIVLGPAAALYGPNAHNGLMYTITKDPRTQPGSTLALGGGNQSVLNARFWHGQVLNERVAFKVTGEHVRGTEFEYVDTVYVGAGAYPELDLDLDFDFLRGEAGLYLTTGADSDVVLSYGGSRSNFLSPTNAGRNQIRDWILHFAQARYASPRLFAQVYHTWSQTDSTYAINQRTQNYVSFIAAGFDDAEARRRSFDEAWAGPMEGGIALPRGAVFQDASRRLNAEVQYNNSVGRTDFAVGAQFQRDIANSRQTYLLDADGAINLDQVGLYGQIEAPLGESGWKAVLAARGDNHDTYGFNFIPRGGVTYTRGAGTWRLTYGRGIAAPTILNMSMNIFAGLALGNGEGFTLSDGSRIEPLEVETIRSIEGGYRGVLGQRWYMDANAYFNASKNFISPLINIAPTAFVGGPLVTHRGDVPISEYQTGLAIGPGDFVLANVNFGRVNTYGFDVGLHYYVSTDINVILNYSFFDFDLDKDDPRNDATRDGEVTDADLPINTPKHKANLAVNASRDRWFGSVLTRWVDTYDFFSGINVAARTNEDLIYAGDPVVEGARVGRTFNYGPLGGSAVVDVNLGFRVSPRATIAGRISNLFDSEMREFVAAPPIGRLVSAELRFDF